jgi:PPOX class probable F420-dependent enzyme
MGRRVFSCDASSGRASIYACKAFNTEESVGSIGERLNEPCPIAVRHTLSDGAKVISTFTIILMPAPIPPTIHCQKYISLKTFRKNGDAVATPVWFGEDADKLYVMTRSDLGKTKRIRNNPQVRVAPCTMRGKVTGPEFFALARILPAEEHAHARQTINRKYWLARLSSPWSRADAFLELSFP